MPFRLLFSYRCEGYPGFCKDICYEVLLPVREGLINPLFTL